MRTPEEIYINIFKSVQFGPRPCMSGALIYLKTCNHLRDKQNPTAWYMRVKRVSFWCKVPAAAEITCIRCRARRVSQHCALSGCIYTCNSGRVIHFQSGSHVFFFLIFLCGFSQLLLFPWLAIFLFCHLCDLWFCCGPNAPLSLSWFFSYRLNSCPSSARPPAW